MGGGEFLQAGHPDIPQNLVPAAVRLRGKRGIVMTNCVRKDLC